MNNATFTVRHKETGEFFAGFSDDCNPEWTVSISDAKAMDANHAREQALLFSAFGIKVQKKPINI